MEIPNLCLMITPPELKFLERMIDTGKLPVAASKTVVAAVPHQTILVQGQCIQAAQPG
jgi:hypothetical protein